MDAGYVGSRIAPRHVPSSRRPSRRPAYDDGEEDYPHHGDYPSRDSRQDMNVGMQANRKRSVPIEPILDDLDHLLQDAMTFYRKFQQDFLQDIHSIESYTDEDLLSRILIAKARASKSPRRQSRGDLAHPGDTQGSASLESPFHTWKQALIEGMRRAVNEIAYCRPGYDNIPGLVRSQISKTCKTITPALQIRNISISNLNTLATHLEMLSIFLNRNGAGNHQARPKKDDGKDMADYHVGDLQDDERDHEQEGWDDGQ